MTFIEVFAIVILVAAINAMIAAAMYSEGRKRGRAEGWLERNAQAEETEARRHDKLGRWKGVRT